MSEIKRSDNRRTTGTTSSGDPTVKPNSDVQGVPALGELAVKRDHGRAAVFAPSPGAPNWVEVNASSGPLRIGTDDLKKSIANKTEEALASNADAGFQARTAAANVESAAPESAKALNACGDHLDESAAAIKRGEPGAALRHSEDAVGCAHDADDKAPPSVKDQTAEIDSLVEHADETLKTKVKEGAIEVLTDVEKIAKLREGDVLEVEIAGGIDVGVGKAGGRRKASITVVKGADGELTYQAHVELLIEGEQKRGKNKESAIAFGGMLGVGMDLSASSPAQAARLIADANTLLDGDGIVSLLEGDTGELEQLQGHVTAVSYFGELGAKAEGDLPLPGFSGKSITVEGAAKVMQVDTFHLDDEGKVVSAQRDRVVELAAAATDKLRLGTADTNVTLGQQLAQPKATLTMSRSWDMGEDGYGLDDMAKMGVEQFTMGTFSADADTESVSLSVPSDGGETTTASMTTTDPGVIEDAVEVLFTDASASGKAAELLESKTLEATTTTHRDAKVSVSAQGLVLYAEASFAVHDEQSRTTSKTTLRELFNRVTAE